jgi:hypothetical protein
MFRYLKSAVLTAALLAATPGFAFDISDEIGKQGIQPTLTMIESLSRIHTPEEKFAQGGLEFLRAVEIGLQTRWRLGVNDSLGILPILRLPVPENPNPAPTDPAFVATFFTEVAARMEAARLPLEEIAATDDFALVIDLADLWFDVNADSARNPGEDASAILGPMLMGWQWDARDPATPLPVVRFDTADAAWLMAYTHLLQGISETVLAYDPTAAITRVFEANAAMGAVSDTADYFDLGRFADSTAIVIGALEQEPDKPRLAAAHAHFLQMIAENRRFWGAVLLETDNDREWLPNDAQQSALGLTLPPGTGQLWMGVLSDGEALLNGKALIPYWRAAEGRGINLRRMFLEPAPIDLMGWVQGYAALPYLEEGRAVSADNWRRFETLMFSDTLLMAVFLN